MPSALLAASVITALAAQAQPVAKTVRPDPLDAKASVPALNYASSFTPSRRQDDQKPASWREANDTVTRIGGWRVYLREAQLPDAPPAAIPAQAKPVVDAAAVPKPNDVAKPMPSGHGSHKTP